MIPAHDINNPSAYWDSVAHTKTFTHPANICRIETLVPKTARVLDYGCGYGRLTSQLHANGFENIIGVDISAELVKRGKRLHPVLDLQAIENPWSIPVNNSSVDLLLLFAVLTCIPANQAQKNLIKLLREKLKPSGLIYISDYYLQQNSTEPISYGYLNSDMDNDGVFSLPEGGTFRHHTKVWMKELLQDFEIIWEEMVPVTTMNGHAAQAVQIIARK